MLEEGDIDGNYISKSKIMHFGTVSLSESPSREATLRAVRYANDAGVRVSFDPNIRFHLWDKGEDEIREEVISVAKNSDIFLPSREEAEFLTGAGVEDSLEEFLSWGPGIVCIKLGEDGCMAGDGKQVIRAPGIKADAVDTTGAGDGFDAGLVYGLLKEYELEKTALYGNVVGSLVVRKRGAMTSLPYVETVEELAEREGPITRCS
jgi:sugar/nucleoside kinase (ribokinase family)